MFRRMFLKIAAFFVLAVAAVLALNPPLREKILGRIKYKWFPPKHVPEDRKKIAVLPAAGETISVETALNSRCCSDGTENQRWLHWGMFDNETKLSSEQIEKVLHMGIFPRFTNHRVEVGANGRKLTFSIDNRLSETDRDWAMIESGMQQQAVSLVCAALGVGMVFQNMGKDGTVISDDVYGNVRYRLAPMQPSYEGSYWTTSAPAKEKPWETGNLPDPKREGTTPLIAALTNLRTKRTGNQEVSQSVVGQLLWAARGRTPHLYKSKPWGMTIPFWTDRIEASSVYWVENGEIHQYVNWEDNRPTHSLRKQGNIGQAEMHAFFRNHFPNKQRAVVIGRNDSHARALWEIGYVLLNLLLQAHVLDISYIAVLLDQNNKQLFSSSVIEDPKILIAV